MKRTITAAVLLLVILALAVLSLYDLRCGIDRMSETIALIREAPSRDRCVELQSLWEELEGRFVLYVPHNKLDELTKEVAALPVLVSSNLPEELIISRLDVLSAYLEDLWRSSLPSYRNLL